MQSLKHVTACILEPQGPEARQGLCNPNGVPIMEYDEKLIEEAVLALLTTFSFDNGNSWKG
ncbi:MAG: hypothetical protein L0G37_17380, partial [Pseudomonas sp.]|nr:hypothetical protein [Pseudomonas sp.]